MPADGRWAGFANGCEVTLINVRANGRASRGQLMSTFLTRPGPESSCPTNVCQPSEPLQLDANWGEVCRSRLAGLACGAKRLASWTGSCGRLVRQDNSVQPRGALASVACGLLDPASSMSIRTRKAGRETATATST